MEYKDIDRKKTYAYKNAIIEWLHMYQKSIKAKKTAYQHIITSKNY